MRDCNYVFKYIVIGDSSVGKTSLISSLLYNKFSKDFSTTIGVDFCTKMISLDDNTIVKMQIWDTAGQESFKSITKCYYRGAIGCIIVFDITNRRSFENVNFWLQDVNNSERTDKREIILVGNKKDLEKQRTVSKKDIDILLKENSNISYMELSAYDNDKVLNCFKFLSRQVVDNLDDEKLDKFGYGAKKVVLKDLNDTKSNYRYCC